MNSGFLERYSAEAGDVLDAILMHSRDCIKLLNRDGELEYVSASAKNALGLADNSNAVGKPWRDFWPESERAALDAAMRSALAGASTRFEGRTHDSSDTVRIWEVTISPVRGDDEVITHLLAVSTEVTAQRDAARKARLRWEQAEEKAGLAADVARELRHRIKNQLAVVNAVTKLLARHTESVPDLARKLEEKLISLGHAQDLLAANREGPITAREAVSEVVKASGAGDRVDVGDMPDAGLPEQSIQQLALLLGELQTNALKHGALRDDDGEVRLTGTLDSDVLTLRWEEDCQTPVIPANKGNGGFQLIRRLGSAGGKQPAIDWRPTGIVVEIHSRTLR